MRTEEQRAYQREYMRGYRRRKGPELKYRYGITVEERDAILEKQGGVCAICEGNATDVDHCHITGAVRGVLCRQCNTALGLFKDDTTRLLRAVEYLKCQKTH